MTVENSELQGYDEAQKEMMDENCIVVDENDRIVGRDSKINCHLNEGKLHRAFSVLIFDSNTLWIFNLIFFVDSGSFFDLISTIGKGICSVPTDQVNLKSFNI